MTACILASAASTMRLTLIATLFLGPLGALAAAQSDEIAISKRGAGLVLFVSLQRQSMS